MSIQQAAQAAVSAFPSVSIHTPRGTFSLPVVMVAIAGAESTWNPGEPGDYGLSGPSCGGYTSWGLWQIHSVHSAYLIQQTGSRNPCDWATWLYNPVNNAKAALAVMGSAPAGLTNWTTWNTGAYEAYLPQAQQAVAAISGGSSGIYVTQVRGRLSTGGIIALVLAAGAAVGGYYLLKRPSFVTQ